MICGATRIVGNRSLVFGLMTHRAGIQILPRMNELASRRQKKGNNPKNTDNGEADMHG